MFKIYIDGRKGSKTLDTININTEKSIDNNGDNLDKMGKKERRYQWRKQKRKCWFNIRDINIKIIDFQTTDNIDDENWTNMGTKLLLSNEN